MHNDDMQQPDVTMFTLQKLVSDLAKVERNHHILDSERSENDVEHSYAVALLCWYIHDKLQLNLDLARLMQYALVHDFVEIYAGDVNSFASAEARVLKTKNEAIALERLTLELQGFNAMANSLSSYELKGNEEAVFVWTVDKMQALILADLDNWRPYKKIDIAYDDFSKKHHEQLLASSPYCEEIFRELLEYCKTTYYNQPKNKEAI